MPVTDEQCDGIELPLKRLAEWRLSRARGGMDCQSNRARAAQQQARRARSQQNATRRGTQEGHECARSVQGFCLPLQVVITTCSGGPSLLCSVHSTSSISACACVVLSSLCTQPPSSCLPPPMLLPATHSCQPRIAQPIDCVGAKLKAFKCLTLRQQICFPE